jgi:hypothetical protein
MWSILGGCSSSDPDPAPESAASTVDASVSNAGPYEDDYSNFIYELLFVDRPDFYEENYKGPFEPPFSTLFGDEVDYDAIEKLAEDETMESRIRMLAFNSLTSAKKEVQEKVLLGTIVEVRLPGGLDVLAVFSDGSARYINHTGKLVIAENPSPFQQEVASVLAASKPIVVATDLWAKKRLPPPCETWHMRTTFLVSDGLRLREGSMDEMESDSTTGPLCRAATLLLMKVVHESANDEP